MANDFKPFATGPGANVTPQADWEALPALLAGFMSGKASAAQINKALRQASFIAAALAQYTADKSGEDVLDDGDIAGFIEKMSAAFGEDFQSKNEKLTAFSGLAGAANRLPYFTGANALALTALTAAGRDLIGKADVPAILEYLGLGDMSGYLQKDSNLSDLSDKSLSRTHLGVPAGVDKQMCTAWVRWTNNGTVCTIQDSFNVSSVTLSAIGQCQVNFSSPMLNTNYSPTYTVDASPNIVYGGTFYSPTTGNVGAACWGGAGSGSGIGLGRANAQFNSMHIYGGK